MRPVPLDASRVKAIVDANLERLRDELWLSDWKISVEYEPLEGDTAAECRLSNADYNVAVIALDPAQFSNQKQVLQALVHELLHVTLARFDLYRDAVIELIPDHVYQDGGGKVEQRLYRHALEQAVEMLQRGAARHLWDNPDPKPEAADGAGLTD